MTDKINPANPVERKRPARIPMSVPRQRLQVPEMPGFHLHWFREDNVAHAKAAYYEHVNRGEIETNQLNPGNSVAADGNTDPGTLVSLVADKTESGTPVRAYLMKLPEELYQEDQRKIEELNARIMEAIFGDEAKVGDAGQVENLGSNVYIDKRKALFQRPTRKAKIGRGR